MESFNVGFTLMIIGMVTVFVFLIIMIVAMNITTKVIQFINKYFPEQELEDKTRKKKKNNINDESEIALAVALAIKERAKVQK